MARFLFVLTRGLEDPTRAVRCVHFAHVAQEAGHHVDVMFTDDAVIYGKEGMSENIVAPTGEEMSTYIEALTRANVTFHV